MFDELRYQGGVIEMPVIDIATDVFALKTFPDRNFLIDHSAVLINMKNELVINGFLILRIKELTEIVHQYKNNLIADLITAGELKKCDDKIYATISKNAFSKTGEKFIDRWPAYPRDVSQSQCASLIKIIRSATMFHIANVFLEDDPIPDQKFYIRAVSCGFGTQVHVDSPHEAPNDLRSLTLWLALLDIEPSMGALFFPQLPRELEPAKEDPWWRGSAEMFPMLSQCF